MELIEILKWRYATKRMTGEKIPQEALEKILEAIRLAPTSYGLQPFKVLVVEDMELKKKIQPIAMGQRQIVECSHLLIFAVYNQLTQEYINEYMQLIKKERNLDDSRVSKLRELILNVVGNRDSEEIFQWNARQAYIAMGYATIAAAAQKIDCVPMEGFHPQELDNLLGLNKRNLRSVLLLPLGYRNEKEDYLAHMKKVRRPVNELVEYVKSIEKESVSV